MQFAGSASPPLCFAPLCLCFFLDQFDRFEAPATVELRRFAAHDNA
jgi:hypothetical protein